MHMIFERLGVDVLCTKYKVPNRPNLRRSPFFDISSVTENNAPLD